MAKLAQFNQLVDNFADSIDFVSVYLSEAHPIDGWKLTGNAYEISQPETIDQRIAASRNLLEAGLKCPLFVDGMENVVAREFAAFPESLYAVKDGRVVYQGLGPYAYDPKDFLKWLLESQEAGDGRKRE
ncbi:hypothetical protein DPMN_018122 [Dreissena polymorpha]|uniref:Iodothyronine deiodinase n=1 Tax=Dreissena polymorpha TaxID=45954 RepID=A0A9D4NIT7_DREPO|nr:hypothetical protein DPMN_018122 [Dreissena polymorpha]